MIDKLFVTFVEVWLFLHNDFPPMERDENLLEGKRLKGLLPSELGQFLDSRLRLAVFSLNQGLHPSVARPGSLVRFSPLNPGTLRTPQV